MKPLLYCLLPALLVLFLYAGIHIASEIDFSTYFWKPSAREQITPEPYVKQVNPDTDGMARLRPLLWKPNKMKRIKKIDEK